MEQWKDVKGYEDLYQVSSLGRIRSKDRKIITSRYSCIRKGKILKGSSNGKGYMKFELKRNGTKKREYIHRLVADAFLENPDGKPCINHKDNNPSNNAVSNLEWCTHKENVEWMNNQGRAKRTESWLDNLHKAQGITYTPVVGENIYTGEEIYFRKMNDVSKAGFKPSSVCRCCKGKAKTHKDFRWSYGNSIAEQ